MASKLLPTFRLARRLSRELINPFGAAPRPSFWWDPEYPSFPSESEIVKEHLGMIEKLLRPLDIPISNISFYRYVVPKTEERATQDQEQAETPNMKFQTNKENISPISSQDFQISFNLREFSREEINVTVIGNSVLCVEAKHESDKDGREVNKYFSRYYSLPHNIDISALKASIGKDGTLKMTAPLVNKQSPPMTERIIPIKQYDAAKQCTPEDSKTSDKGNTEGA